MIAITVSVAICLLQKQNAWREWALSDCYTVNGRTGALARKQGRIQDFPLGGAWTHFGGGGFGLQRGHFSVKMYAKTKELGPVGGVRRHAPPRSAYGKG